MRRSIFIILFLFLNGSLAYAQQGNSVNQSEANKGSVYSRFGVGIPTDYGSSGADGQSLQGVSENESLVPNISNPAIWGSTVYGMATGGLGINNYNAKSNSGSAKNSNVYLNQFQLQLPIYKGKLGISASFSPYTRSAFKVNRALPTPAPLRDTTNFKTTDTGSGGISKYELGVGWKINRYISLGYGGSLVHASIDNHYFTEFNDAQYQSVNSTIQTSASGFGNRFGAYFSLPSLHGKHKSLHLGLVVNFPVQLHGNKVQQRTYVTGNPADKNNNVEQRLASGDIQLPLGVTAGLTYKPSQEVAISAEGKLDKWSNYTNDLQQTSQDVSFVDRTKVGAGINYYPVYLNSDKFLSHFKYRFGTSYDTGHLKINGQKINTFMISAGLGILSPTRVRGFNSSVDISIHYGIRGTKSNNLVKESFWGVKLSVNLAELFFFRPKLR